MLLDKEQTEELFLKYMPKVEKAVSDFKRRSRSSYLRAEDLRSECLLVFADHIRRSKSMEDVNRFPAADMLHAMCLYSLRCQPITYPQTRTADYRATISAIADRMCSFPYETLPARGYDTEEDAIWRVVMENFHKSLAPMEKEVLALRADGMTVRDIGKNVGTSHTSVVRNLSAMRKKFAACSSDVLQ